MPRFDYQNELKRLLSRYLKKEATDEERIFLDQYYDYFNNDANVLDGVDDEEKKSLSDSMYSNVKSKTFGKSVFKHISMRIFWRVAAVFILVIIGGGIVYFSKFKNDQVVKHSTIAPASSSATLLLADGTEIALDSSNNLLSANQDSVTYAIQNGHLAYTGKTSKTLYNTIKTERGGLYNLTLSDGTKVWLNTASSLHFPIAFTGTERRVKLSGEAYFEVAEDKLHPFRVEVENIGEIEVLGTRFNVNAYAGHAQFRATLLQGKVKVAQVQHGKFNQGKSVVLSPGQQAAVTGQDIQVRNNVDVSETMSWRNDMFYFDDIQLDVILEDLARWYDVDIEYQCTNEVKSRKYFMIIKRSAPLNEVLKSLQTSGVKYELESRKLIIK